MGLFKRLFGGSDGGNKYAPEHWESSGREFFAILTDTSEKAEHFLERFIGLAIEAQLRTAPTYGEFYAAVRATKGLAISSPDKTNAFLITLLSQVILIGNTTYDATTRDKSISMPAYLKMFEDYYANFGTEKMQTLWFFITKPELPFLNEEQMIGHSYWRIAMKYAGMAEMSETKTL